MISFACLASFVPLDPIVLSLVVFVLFVLISIALYYRLQKHHWLDRFSPLVGIGIGLTALVAYLAVFLAWGNATLDSQMWQMVGQLTFTYVGGYLFVLIISSFVAGATRQKPSRFYRPVLLLSVICYGAMLLMSLSTRT
ncbi:hypothetical protein EVJ24_08415 [Exiguobacterium sp. SH1S21]|uniref:hypothetical protein n=1 Tax=unclassified Exiguobacterium TaxID=2644629 RepID=UPI00103BB784|nr:MULTISPECIES: hypothetical protein [unclassified Exiguobacterium]TCI53704.1 hypothetical protein EVJ24_08415 [Exiguobacterium sp. SH1S21]TCI72379.1 hypothetical protein EVJ22_05525 [Exiguobacterium sp. SH0S7]